MVSSHLLCRNQHRGGDVRRPQKPANPPIPQNRVTGPTPRPCQIRRSCDYASVLFPRTHHRPYFAPWVLFALIVAHDGDESQRRFEHVFRVFPTQFLKIFGKFKSIRPKHGPKGQRPGLRARRRNLSELRPSRHLAHFVTNAHLLGGPPRSVTPPFTVLVFVYTAR